jgi:hypothetical protein
MRLLLLAALSAAVLTSNAQANHLFNNGPLITNPTGGTSSIAGLPISQTEAGTSIGRTARGALGHAVADDFLVTGPGWDLDSATFYVYLSGQNLTHPTAADNPVTHARVNLWTDVPFSVGSPPPLPNPLPTPVLAAAVDLPVTSAEFIGHRTSATSTASIRPMFAITVSLDALPNAGMLNPGSYWLEWAYLSQNPNALLNTPLVTPRASAFNLNARQFNVFDATNVVAWFEARDGFSATNPGLAMAFPFELHGQVVPEPSALTLCGVSLFLLGKFRLRSCAVTDAARSLSMPHAA